MYDFDSAPDRRPWDSVKWSFLARDCPAGGPELSPLWVADMDFAAPPEIRSAVESRAAHPVYGYTGLTGTFFAAFAAWMRERHALELDPRQFVFCPGVVPGLALAVRAFTGPGDGVLIQPPVYHPFAQVVRRAGRRVVENPLRRGPAGYEMDFEDLDRRLGESKMMILCSPHNPVGRVWSPAELERVAGLARAHGVVLVSDEIHSDIVYAPERHSSLLGLDRADRPRLVLFHAPSKTFNLAGLQSSVAVIPDDALRAGFEAELLALGINSPNVFGARAAEAAWRSGGAWLDELLPYLHANWRYLAERVAGDMPRLELLPIEGSYLAWIDFRGSGIAGATEPGILHRHLVEKAQLWCDEGSKFGRGGEGFVRLNFACPRSLLAAALDRLAASLPG
ncbi:MAG TPA: MalY/PatB family protein [Rectinemataceae bacterium]|nr:MalY/PatB family protein [Rectinemataceae bacterium]